MLTMVTRKSRDRESAARCELDNVSILASLDAFASFTLAELNTKSYASSTMGNVVFDYDEAGNALVVSIKHLTAVAGHQLIRLRSSNMNHIKVVIDFGLS